MTKPIDVGKPRCKYCAKCVGITHNIFYMCDLQEWFNFYSSTELSECCSDWEFEEPCTLEDVNVCIRIKRKQEYDTEQEFKRAQRWERCAGKNFIQRMFIK